EGLEQIGSFAVFDYILRKLADVEIERDEVVYVAQLSGCKLGFDPLIGLAADYDFAPGLCRKRMRGRRGPAPAFAKLKSQGQAFTNGLMQCGRIDASCNLRR